MYCINFTACYYVLRTTIDWQLTGLMAAMSMTMSMTIMTIMSIMSIMSIMPMKESPSNEGF